MAGFDLKVPTIPNERNIAKATLRFVQNIAKEYGIEISYLWKPRNSVHCAHYYVTVDGSLPSIESWSNNLISIIPYFVEGYRSATQQKTKLGIVIPISILKAQHEFSEELRKIIDSFPNIEHKGIISSFKFNTENLDSLSEIVNSLSEQYYQYVHGKSSSELLIENIHTIVEGLLKKYYGRKSNKMKLFKIIELANNDKIISDDEYSILEKLRKIRNKVKHEAISIPEEIITEIVWPINTIIQKIIYHIEGLKKA